jgi:Zn-dependent peptidase ImmA (M78 family)
MGEKAQPAVKYIAPDAIAKFASDLLERYSVTEPSVPVERLAHDLGLTVEYTDLGDEISGVLVMADDSATIGVNDSQPPVRQRFTIAHEIGHYILHRNWSELFIDKEYEARFRDSRSSRSKHPEEIQANMFAAALLMPENFLKAIVEENAIDIGDDEQVAKLAELFQVSLAAITYRMTNLGILK